ncbi:MAG TPA: hypothetical protein PKA38_04210 [Candidatus Levybacteria bacterium]|nr:hypothetical protein [Candidatus Levybacteria bacterium]
MRNSKEMGIYLSGREAYKGTIQEKNRGGTIGRIVNAIKGSQPGESGQAGIRGSIIGTDSAPDVFEAGHGKSHEAESIPEKSRVEAVRRFNFEDTENVLRLMDEEALGHLSPTPYVPNWEDPRDIRKAVGEFYNYSINLGDDSKKFIPTVAVNPMGEVIAFAGMRLRGDPFVPAGRRIASLERLVVGQEHRQHDVATIFVASLAQDMFTNGHYGQNSDFPAVEIRAWTMEDEKAGDWRRNHSFMKKMGFQPIPDSNWPDYRAKRGIPDDGRGNATQWKLKPEIFEGKKREDLTIRPSLNTKLA